MYQCMFIVSVILCQLCPSFSDECALSDFPPDSQSGCCGLANGSSLKKNTSIAEIDEYPWMALIEYKKKRDGDLEYRCSGILISGRYLLTTAQCFKKIDDVGKAAIHVCLGEYDTNNEGKDCVKVKPGQEICNDGATCISIEKVTSHPNFNFCDSTSCINDIALIRLAKQVQYTDFIRPICLPSLDITLHAPKHLYMTVAGWGEGYDRYGNQSNVLRRVHVPFVDMQICDAYYEETDLTNNQLCAGSKQRDSCIGDAGGPLMYFNRKKTELGGIVSFGPSPCGQDIPSVYTKVFGYKDWIISVIEDDSRTSSTSTTTDSGLIYFRE